MMKSSCELLPQSFPKVFEFADVRSTYIAIYVVNNFLSAIMLNIVTIQAMSKPLSLPKTSKKLLVGLAVFDVSVLGQPLYTSLLVKWL